MTARMTLHTFTAWLLACSALIAGGALAQKPKHKDAPMCSAPVSVTAANYLIVRSVMDAAGAGRLRLSGVDMTDERFPAEVEARAGSAMMQMKITGIIASAYEPLIKRRSCSGTLTMPGAERLGTLPVAYTLQPYEDGSDVHVTAKLLTMPGYLGVNQFLGVQSLMLQAMFPNELKAAEKPQAIEAN